MHTQKAHTPGWPPGSSRFSPSLAPPSSTRFLRHRPETTLLYQVIREYWPEFQAELASHGKHLPAFICRECGDEVKIIASIEDPAVIRKILAHLDKNATSAETGLLPDCRAPPANELV